MSYLSIDVCITLYRLAYADYLLSSMMDLSLVSRRINLLYDIGCKLESHWKVSGSASSNFGELACQVQEYMHMYS